MSDLVINSTITIPSAELQFSYSRSRGPGGQNVNKVNSKATLRWEVQHTEALPPVVKQRFFQHWGARINKEGVLVLHSEEHRDQRSNMEACLTKLRQMIAVSAKRPKVRIPTKPSRGSVRRRQEAKQQQSQRKSTRRQSKNVSSPDE